MGAYPDGEDSADKAEFQVARLLKLQDGPARRVLALPARGRLDGKKIRKAYLRLAAVVHPDKCCLPGATQAFQILKAAYDELTE